MTNPPIPAPPSGDNFSTQTHPNALVAIKVLRVDNNWPDSFNRNEGRPVSATFLDVWVLADAPDVGTFASNVVNTSMLGRQLAGSVGTTFYGRITAQRTGNGTSYVLGEPYPSDIAVIEGFKARLAAEAAAPVAPAAVAPHQYQNEPAWQQPAPAAVAPPAVAQPVAQPAYVPPSYGAPGAPAVPPAPTSALPSEPPF